MNSSPINFNVLLAGIPAANTSNPDPDLGSDEFKIEDPDWGAGIERFRKCLSACKQTPGGP
jgi:hypothetical protein